jgi:septin family protein
VTIVPVISKADTMTEAELTTYRAEVMSMLQQPGKFVGARNLPPLEVNLFSFAEAALKELGTTSKALPVAVVCSREQETLKDPGFLASLGLNPEDVGGEAKQPVRTYHWGACYPLNRGHSDLILLKRLLLGDQVESLYAMLDDSYK